MNTEAGGKRMSNVYCAHDCRNTRNNTCNNRWIDVDMTGATTQIPTWKLCKSCCEKLGIDFDKQKPSDYRTKEQNEKIALRIAKLKEERKNK